MNPPTVKQMVSSERSLLVIDDESEIVKALNRQFRRQYTVYVAESAEAGYEIMMKVPIQVIISDQRMPGMNGAEFFRKVRHAYPDAIRLLLTGYADIQAVIAAINDGHIFRYITKPWDPVELDTIVYEAFVRHDLILSNRRLMCELQESNEMLEAHVEQRTIELSEANEKLRLMGEQKDKFLGMIAHDLRGPLGNLQLCLDLLRDRENSSENREMYCEIIDEISSKMLCLVNDLLDIRAIEAGQLVLENDAVDIQAFIQRICRLNMRSGAQKGITLVPELASNVTTACFDPKRIEQVLDNLIGNAFKFSHAGTTVRLSVKQEENLLFFSIIDQGQGIKAEDSLQLFNAFQKTSTKPTAGEQSSGLGLSICKRIVDLHNGRIEVSSQYGIGTTFTVTLPE